MSRFQEKTLIANAEFKVELCPIYNRTDAFLGEWLPLVIKLACVMNNRYSVAHQECAFLRWTFGHAKKVKRGSTANGIFSALFRYMRIHRARAKLLRIELS